MSSPFLFKKIDNAQLVVFRVFYGLLVSAECYGAIGTGWIRRTLIEPKFTFTFIGFEWLQPLPGNGMYVYFAIMGTLGLLITLGYKYRFSALCICTDVDRSLSHAEDLLQQPLLLVDAAVLHYGISASEQRCVPGCEDKTQH